MTVNTTLAGLSQSAAANGPDGASDPPSALDDAIRNALAFIALLRDGAHVYAASIAGTNTLTGSMATSPTAYVTGQAYRFIAANANTGAVTLNLNALGAKAITKNGTAALTGGEIAAGSVVTVAYDGTRFQLQNVTQLGTLGTTGAVPLGSNGLVLRWGFVAGSVSAAQPVSFATAYPTALVGVWLQPAVTGQPLIGTLESSNTSGFSFSLWTPGGTRTAVGAFWLALGY